MKLLLVHPGASVSTHDVYVGVSEALTTLGHTVVEYAMDGRIAMAGRLLELQWRAQRRRGLIFPRPNPADITYQAGVNVLERALRHRPDWVIVVSGMYFHPDLFVLLRRAGMRVGVLLTESPYDIDSEMRIVPHVDIAWTPERLAYQALNAVNEHVHYLPHAYNANRHHPDVPVPDDTPAHDVVFVGTGFAERIELLERVNWDGIDFGLYGAWSLLGSRHPLRRFLRDAEIDNRRAVHLYRKAKVGVNLHRQSMGFGRDVPRITGAQSLNPRAYELAACGCVFVSDHRRELGDVFNKLVPTFATAEDCEAQLRRLLSDDRERERLRAGLIRSVQAHTWLQRAKSLLATLHAHPRMRPEAA